ASAEPVTTGGGTTTLSASVTGGQPPYEYSLNGGAFQELNTFIVEAGTYTVTGKDFNGCTMISNTVTITDPVLLTSFLTYTGPVSIQNNTQATLTATLLNSDNKGINGQTIQFTVGSQSVTAKTNGQGNAAAKLVINQDPGIYDIITYFAGNTTYSGSSDIDQFTINATTVTVTASLVGTVTKVYDGDK